MTLHPTKDFSSSDWEQIKLYPLDEIVDELGILHVDLVKLDIDGHEPSIIRGASKALRRFRPTLILEFSQLNLLFAGSDVKQQASLLRELGYVLCNEKTQKPYDSEIHFLMECGNFNHSCNVLAICAGIE